MRHLFYIISQQKCKINIYKLFFDCNVILLKKEDIIQKICPLCIEYAYYFVIITFCSYSIRETLAPSSSEIKRIGVYVRSFSINAGESSLTSLPFTYAVSESIVIKITTSLPVLTFSPVIVTSCFSSLSRR